MDYQIETQFEGPGFVAVPNEVAQSGKLSPEALGVLVYLASLPRGFLVRVCSIRETFALGRDKWQRIARELREVGAMDLREARGPGGRVIGKRMAVRWPDLTDSRETRSSDREPGKPTVGKPAKQDRETRKTGPANPVPYKEETQKTERATVKPPAPRQPRRLPPVGVGAVGSEPDGQAEGLDAFQRACLREGKTVLVSGALLKPGSQQFERLAQAAGVR